MSSQGASREAIEHHYDVGADFYALWLDPQLTYSCALWPTEVGRTLGLDDDLDAAQAAKLDLHARWAGATRTGAAGRDGEKQVRRVLDVGCGWGSMLGHLVDQYGVTDGTGLTLSSDQAARIAAGGRPQLEIHLTDWRDHQPSEPYDGIVSIGSFEHFARGDLGAGERRHVYEQFFERCWAWLRPGGRLSLQSIGMEDVSGGDGPLTEFLSRQVFPESALPRLADIVTAADRWFRVQAVRSDAAHYEHTLHLWQQRLEARKAEATELVGRRTYRHYLRYLRVCRAMFDRGNCTLYRVAFLRRHDPGLLDGALVPAGLPRRSGA
ncbi:MAG: cyclopropane-fatty-acyl-phospholipid synthase family protein [Actinomycetota bacterium]|nr:cyclopropane-fatty-acyl-phospholipid synthase family protein [Actinomycetota bacterium]